VWPSLLDMTGKGSVREKKAPEHERPITIAAPLRSVKPGRVVL